MRRAPVASRTSDGSSIHHLLSPTSLEASGDRKAPAGSGPSRLCPQERRLLRLPRNGGTGRKGMGSGVRIYLPGSPLALLSINPTLSCGPEAKPAEGPPNGGPLPLGTTGPEEPADDATAPFLTGSDLMPSPPRGGQRRAAEDATPCKEPQLFGSAAARAA